MVGKVVQLLKKYRSKKRIANALVYLRKGNSHLLDNFSLRVDMPQPGRVYAQIGDDNLLDCEMVFESSEGLIRVGSGSYVGASSLICRTGISIGNNVFIAWGCTIYDHNSHSLNHLDRRADLRQQLIDHRSGISFIHNKNWSTVKSAPIVIEDDAWIGMNCIILKGVTIGEGAIVAAGSVVNKSVEPWTVVAGNPARKVKDIQQSSS